MPTRVRRCAGVKCRTKYNVIESVLAKPFVEGRDDDLLACPKCGSEVYVPVLALGRGIQLGGEGGVGKHFPYRDRGLGTAPDGGGIEVQSAAHRRHLLRYEQRWSNRQQRWIEKERPERLIPMEEAPDIDGWVDRDESEREMDEAAYLDYVREMAEGPNRAEYFAAQEQIIRSNGGTVEKAVPEINTASNAEASDAG